MTIALQIPIELNKTYTNVKVVGKLLDITSEVEHKIIYAILSVFKGSAFSLSPQVKSAVIAHFAGEMTQEYLSVIINRLIKKGAVIKEGNMYGLSPAFKNCDKAEQILIKY